MPTPAATQQTIAPQSVGQEKRIAGVFVAVSEVWQRECERFMRVAQLNGKHFASVEEAATFCFQKGVELQKNAEARLVEIKYDKLFKAECVRLASQLSSGFLTAENYAKAVVAAQQKYTLPIV